MCRSRSGRSSHIVVLPEKGAVATHLQMLVSTNAFGRATCGVGRKDRLPRAGGPQSSQSSLRRMRRPHPPRIRVWLRNRFGRSARRRTPPIRVRLGNEAPRGPSSQNLPAMASMRMRQRAAVATMAALLGTADGTSSVVNTAAAITPELEPKSDKALCTECRWSSDAPSMQTRSPPRVAMPAAL